ncbi:Protein of unknown function [Pyronema omphalodes CBS 100304]|uniref:Secreted protein n=1 Tax=Pyronema omphalodes (strain CBS 100304) TaxID=1076935 RepID=U4LCG3_PYROM|nr:Protein of unknown function [Pyronema omphalodes CBS 100304]
MPQSSNECSTIASRGCFCRGEICCGLLLLLLLLPLLSQLSTSATAASATLTSLYFLPPTSSAPIDSKRRSTPNLDTPASKGT